jgi:hypothetical protein
VGPVLNDLQKNDSLWCCSLPLDFDFFVGCNEEQNVLEVNFANQGIAGSIVGEWFGLLSHLQSLDLSFNLLSGSLPTLSSMSQMTELALYTNNFEGSIKALASMSQITELWLSNNNFEGSLVYLAGHAELSRVDLQNNRFSRRLDALLDMDMHPNLVSVNVSANLLIDDTLAAFISPPSDRVFYLDIRGNSFACPFPVLGRNVIFERDSCHYDWVFLVGVASSFLAVVAGLAYLYVTCCTPPTRVVWSGKWLNWTVVLVTNLFFSKVCNVTWHCRLAIVMS